MKQKPRAWTLERVLTLLGVGVVLGLIVAALATAQGVPPHRPIPVTPQDHDKILNRHLAGIVRAGINHPNLQVETVSSNGTTVVIVRPRTRVIVKAAVCKRTHVFPEDG